MTGPILQTLRPVGHNLGDFKVYRSLPSRERTMVGPFVFFDQAGPATLDAGTGIDVRPHPHINLATVTYMLKGRFEHRDSLGTVQVIEPGAVNLMTAGKGIVHSERTPPEDRPGGSDIYAVQTWLALPEAAEEMDPAFEHVPKADLPICSGAGAEARIIMGSLWGQTAPVTTYAGTIYADIHLSPGGSIPIDAEADERALYLLEGEASLDGEALTPETLAVLRPGQATTVRSENGAQIMLCGGEAFASPRHVYWNFVSSRPERIDQAIADWKEERFPIIPTDHDERIPFPAGRPKTVSYP
ncbi:pirin family protein [Parasphingopyxis marina]|uniref:Pirin family protein n=1 Tax=Parasphingopyxis marina TaxID=2761622 RepID=A0A842I3K6_9SPHN|nr:pirin family protein [Parasphingopyxis marina]MBC2779010.1 pirin family protein [Parasphingopyxis marina]